MLGEHRATIMAGGHSHVQMVRQHNGVMIVNAGSVGEPLEHMPIKEVTHIMPWAEYTIVNWGKGALSIESRRVPIDIDVVRQAVLTSNMPEAAKEVWFHLRK